MRHGTEIANASAPADLPSVETLLLNCLPSVQQWARRRLPRAARGNFEPQDLVQEAALRMLKRRQFEPRHAQAVQAYMRQTMLNLIRDDARRLACRPASVELGETLACREADPLEFAVSQERRARYEDALRSLKPRDRQLLVARVEQELEVKDIARVFGLRSTEAARMAVSRALTRLKHKLNRVT